MKAQQAHDEITAHIEKLGQPYSEWYAGITSDVDQRLHGDHGVPKENHWYSYRSVDSAAGARGVEQALLDAGCDGGSGGGDTDSRIVYAYLKTSDTNP